MKFEDLIGMVALYREEVMGIVLGVIIEGGPSVILQEKNGDIRVANARGPKFRSLPPVADDEEDEDGESVEKEKGPRATDILRCINNLAGTQPSNAITANMISSQLGWRRLDRRMKRVVVQFGTIYNAEGEIRAHGMIMTDESEHKHRYFINPVMADQVQMRLETSE
jgi:hypothetical protein